MNTTEIKKELQESLLEAHVPSHAVITWPPKDLVSRNPIWERLAPLFAKLVTRLCRCGIRK
jgi:hypothetical protein